MIELAKQATANIKPQDDKPTTANEQEQAEAEPQEEQKPLETPEEEEKPLEEELGEEKPQEDDEQEEEEEDDDDDETEMVPKATMLKVKSKLKDEIRKLKSTPTLKNIDEIAESVAEKYGTDPDFIRDILKESTGYIREEFKQEINTIRNKDNAVKLQEKKNQLFDGLYERFIAKNPNLKDVVNKDFIKKEVFSPENSKKKLSEIVKDIYGGVIEVKKESFDGYKPSKQESEPENLLNADSATQKEIANNPKLRKKYGEELAKKATSFL
jgi:hypothetical protein